MHEGTVSRWLKQVGDEVKLDEPIVEIMTDKVNTELPSPASGTLVKITIPEGDNVEVFAQMGVIEEDSAKAKELLSGAGGAGNETPASQAADAPAEKRVWDSDKESAVTSDIDLPETQDPAAQAFAATESTGTNTSSGGERQWFSPVVRAIAKENGVSDAELAKINGSGKGGRVNKKDIEQYLAGGRSGKQTETPQTSPAAGQVQTKPEPVISAPTGTPVAEEGVQVTKLTAMRKMIAEAMQRASEVPVVSTLIDVDVTDLVKYRSLNKQAFEEAHGIKLTYTPFFIKALTDCLVAFPMLNSTLSGSEVHTPSSVNMGCAVSLGKDGSGGLIVPVIRNCESKSLPEIAKDLNDIALRARDNALTTEDVKGGTFTITNPGSYGAVLGTPMIVAPQAGIAGIYGIKETPVIIDGMIAIRSIMNVVLTYDHRLVDGLVAGRFLQMFKKSIEGMDIYR